MGSPSVIIFSDNTGWHEEQLLAAFRRRDADARVVSMRDCGIGFSAGRDALYLPGGAALPDAVLVRAVPDGTFEQVTLRLGLLHALEASGVTVYNPGQVIERTVDKAMTTFLLQRAGVPTPMTWVCESAAEAARVVTQELNAGRRLVAKPLFGNCGRGLILLDTPDLLPSAEELDGVYYLQRYIGHRDGGGRDWRVFVVGDHAVAAMERVSSHWITNRARGGQCLPAVLTGDLRSLAETAAAAVGASYAGVDIIRDDDGNYLVLEVNGVPAWRGLQTVHVTGVAELLAEDLLRRLRLLRQPPSAVG